MTIISRREFLDWIARSGTAAALLQVMPVRIAEALEAAVKEFPLIWLQLSSSDLCFFCPSPWMGDPE